jgi:hypothetical protein
MKIIFWCSTKCLGLAQNILEPVEGQVINVNNFLIWHKKFGTGTRCKSIFGLAKNILGPVEERGIKKR